MRDDNAVSNYFIAILWYLFGSNFRVKQSFPRAWLSQYWSWISSDCEKKLKEDS